MFHMFENEMLGVSIRSDCTILVFIFMPTLPWTSFESSFKRHVAHQFVIKIASQKGTQRDKVVYIFLYIKSDSYARKRLAINYYNQITIHKDDMWGSCKIGWFIFSSDLIFLHIVFYSNVINIWWNHQCDKNVYKIKFPIWIRICT